jgi:phage tail-like protein
MAEPAFPVAFHFTVKFTGGSPNVDDVAFQEVSGLESGIDTEPLVEGGENRFVHQLPKPAKRGNIKLKRGITANGSGLVQWCKSVMEGDFTEPIKPKSLDIMLLDENGDPVASWNVGNAYPVKWNVGGFDAMKNELAVETIELAYNTLVRNL